MIEKGFSFENIQGNNENIIEELANNEVVNVSDLQPLTTTVEPHFKQIKTTFVIFLQIIIVVILTLIIILYVN